jgi:hypothetical protein
VGTRGGNIRYSARYVKDEAETAKLLIRRQTLYPSELLGHMKSCIECSRPRLSTDQICRGQFA